MKPTDRLRKLLSEATPGPWIAVDKDPAAEEARAHAVEFHRPDGESTREFLIRWRPNALLVVAAVNALPGLLDVAEAAQALYDTTARDAATIGKAYSALAVALAKLSDSMVPNVIGDGK